MLTGVGVGPGDPQLLTLLGLSALRDADVVMVPVRDDDPAQEGYAERVVRHHLPGAPLLRAPFALTDRGGVTDRRAQAWDAAASLVVAEFERGARRIAFATIGDPNVYSTFGYLASAVRERLTVEVRTVPGITAMQALAAASGTALCEGSETLVLLPLRGSTAPLEAALGDADTSVVVYKGGRHWPVVRESLVAQGRLETAIIGSHLGREDQQIDAAAAVHDDLPYLSTVLVPPARTGRGGAL